MKFHQLETGQFL